MFQRVLLRDNRNLTSAEFVRLEELRARIVGLVEVREAYVSAYGLDPEFSLPDANWKNGPHNDFFNAYRHVSVGDYNVLNRLRFWVQAFSGYQLMTLTMAAGLRSVNPIPDDFDNWIQIHRPSPDVHVQNYCVLAAKLPRDLIYSPPRMMGEIGWNVNGVVVNYDTYSYQERITLLHEAGLIEWLRSFRSPRVLEIGGGYGALALALLQIVPAVRYTICDLPESLLFSGLYLSNTTSLRPHMGDVRLATVSQAKIHLLPNYMFGELLDAGASFDLIINTLSLAEMSRRQAEIYAAGVSKLIGESGLFFEQNGDNSAVGWLNVKPIIATHFRFRRQLPSKIIPIQLVGGDADIWSNNPILVKI